MKNKPVSLYDLIKLKNNPDLSKEYVAYICGINSSTYRHQEILDISILLNCFTRRGINMEGFIFGYIVPQLNKEFDLLKIGEDYCLNIELKSETIDRARIKKQLIQNQHYLKLLCRKTYLFTFVSSSRKMYTLNENGFEETSIEKFQAFLQTNGNGKYFDLDEIFIPKNILVSPLNSTDKFLHNNYILTENQEKIKSDIMNYIATKAEERIIGLTGGPGTGKTLLIYDIAKELAKNFKILIIHSGILCEGHYILNNELINIHIISAKDLRLRTIRDVDVVIVDEAHRLYNSLFEKVQKWVIQSKKICIFSYDAGQKLSKSEDRMRTSELIDQFSKNKTYKLTNKIRTNKELALFITCLRDLSKYRDEYKFPNVKVIFEPDKKQAVCIAKSLEQEDYTYISYTPSAFNHDLDYQKDKYNTHTVIGQEFESVCMILDDNFYYNENKLAYKAHPNPDYLFGQLLYQGLTRVRSRIALVVTEETLLAKILILLNNN